MLSSRPGRFLFDFNLFLQISKFLNESGQEAEEYFQNHCENRWNCEEIHIALMAIVIERQRFFRLWFITFPVDGGMFSLLEVLLDHEKCAKHDEKPKGEFGFSNKEEKPNSDGRTQRKVHSNDSQDKYGTDQEKNLEDQFVPGFHVA
jgi:hypothetical protein